MFALIGLTHIIYDEVFTLWALLRPVEGGLDLIREGIQRETAIVSSNRLSDLFLF
jgi:hypothetical protein